MTSLRALTWLLVLLLLVPASVLAWLGFRSADAYDAAVARRLNAELREAEATVRRQGGEVVEQLEHAARTALEPVAERVARRLPFEEPTHLLRGVLPLDRRLPYAVVQGDGTSLGSTLRVRALRLRGADDRLLYPAEHRPDDGASEAWDAVGLLSSLRRHADRLHHAREGPDAALALWQDARERLPTTQLRATADVEGARHRVLAATTRRDRKAVVEQLEATWPLSRLRAVGRPLVRLWLAADARDRILQAAAEGWLDEVPLTTSERARIRAWQGESWIDRLGVRTIRFSMPEGAHLEIDHDDPSGDGPGGVVATLLQHALGDVPIRVHPHAGPPPPPDRATGQAARPVPRSLYVSIPRPGSRPVGVSLRHRGLGAALRERRTRRIVTAVGVVSLLALMVVGAALARRAVAREQAARRLRDEFVANVSHELRTPLTSVTMHAEMLAEEADPSPERRRTLARVIRAEGARLAALVDDLLDFAALERGTRRLEPEPVDLVRAARDAARPYETLAARDGVTLEVVAPSGEVHAMADGGALSRILANLLSNAWRHGRPSRDGGPGRIRVVVGRAPGGTPTVEIRDDGRGIPVHEREAIFERFRRGALARRVEGTGIGLALARDLARAMDGDLAVEEDAAAGETTFRLTLPALPALENDDR